MTVTERRVGDIFRTLLGAEEIGRDDNFFDLGGHSLLALSFVSLVREQTGRTISLARIFREPTVERIADALESVLAEEAGSRTSRWIVPLQTEGTRPPLFFVPALDGDSTHLVVFTPHLGMDQPAYGLRAIWRDGVTPPPTTLPEIAKAYVDALVEFHKADVYRLCGFSAGCTLVWEMTRQLQARGAKVIPILIDGSTPGAPTDEAGRPQVDELFEQEDQLYTRYSDLIEAHLTRGEWCSLGDLRAVANTPMLDFLIAIGLGSRDNASGDARILDGRDLALLRVCQTTGRAIRGPYEPFSFDEALLITGSRSPTLAALRNGWARLASTLIVEEVACAHDEIVFFEPYIGDVARCISRFLERYADT